MDPASRGYNVRYAETGSVAYRGVYWSDSPYSTLYFENGYVLLSKSAGHAKGFAVRYTKE